jgi:Holliday junction resolvasome RuvABC endonuclease subunit
MSVDELETIASRLRMIIRDAVDCNQNRKMVLNIIAELSDEIQDEADELALAMARYHRETV